MSGETKANVRVFDDVATSVPDNTNYDYTLDNSFKLPFQEYLNSYFQNLGFETKVILASIVLGFLATIFDGFIDYYFFYDLSFSEIFFTDIPANEVYNRALLFITFTLFGFISSKVLTGYKNAETSLKQMNEDLEARVMRRTEKLIKANNKFQVEAVEKSRIEKALRYRIEFIDIITRFSTRLINIQLNEIDNAINELLEKIAVFEKVERAYTIFEEDYLFRIKHSWADGDIVENERLFDFRELKLITDSLANKGYFQVENIEEISETHVAERKLFGDSELKSVIIVPLRLGDDILGYIGFETYKKPRYWSESSINILGLVSQMIVNVLKRKMDSDTIKETEDRYRKLFDEVPVGLYRTTPEGKILDANKAIVRLLGYSSKEELVSESVTHLYNVESEREKFIKNLIDNEVIYNYHVSLKRKDGNLIEVLDTSRVVKDDSGNVHSFEGNMRKVEVK